MTTAEDPFKVLLLIFFIIFLFSIIAMIASLFLSTKIITICWAIVAAVSYKGACKAQKYSDLWDEDISLP